MNDVSRLATIVSFYGTDKPPQLTALIQTLQSRFVGAAGAFFRPRPAADVHATVIGLENGGNVDLVGLCDFLTEALTRSPLTLQFGGFADRDHRITSAGSRLYDRALSVGADKVVLIGWPIDAGGEPMDRLDVLRRALRRFGARHRYHDTPEARDPDAYMVIGDLMPGAPDAAVTACVDDGRALLARAACRVALTEDDVRLARYVDTRLPAASTRSWSLPELHLLRSAPGPTRPPR
jgi:hypothetical protein